MRGSWTQEYVPSNSPPTFFIELTTVFLKKTPTFLFVHSFTQKHLLSALEATKINQSRF